MIRTIRAGRNHWLSVFFCVVIGVLFLQGSLSAQVPRKLPEKVPPKRSSQIQDGFGINSDLPSRSLSAVGPLVVDTDVRRWVQVDSYRPVRE